MCAGLLWPCRASCQIAALLGVVLDIMLGVPCRTRTAHVVLLGTIRIKSREKELPPECGDALEDASEQAGIPNAGRGPDGLIEKCHGACLLLMPRLPPEADNSHFAAKRIKMRLGPSICGSQLPISFPNRYQPVAL